MVEPHLPSKRGVSSQNARTCCMQGDWPGHISNRFVLAGMEAGHVEASDTGGLGGGCR